MRLLSPSSTRSIRPRIAFALTFPLFALLLCGARVASAQCLTNSNCMWPMACEFMDTSFGPISFPPTAMIRGLSFSNFTSCTPESPGGGFGLVSFFEVFFDLSLDGGAHWTPTFANGDMQASLGLTSAPGANPRTYQTLVLALDIDVPGTVSTPPMFIRIASGNSSGETQITASGGGQFRIESFFDVFLELSLDSGRTWAAGTQPARMVLGHGQATAVRTSTWGALKSFYR